MIQPLIAAFNAVFNVFSSIFNLIAQTDIVEVLIDFFSKS